MAKVYIDTSVVIALANPQDSFHRKSLRFMEAIRKLSITLTIGPPVLPEIAKAVRRRGLESALRVLQALDKYEIELADLDSIRLLNLVELYIAYGTARTRYRFDLLHYASATLLNCTHVASWDKAHFNKRIESIINRVNSMNGLTNLKVGDPTYIGRSLGLG